MLPGLSAFYLLPLGNDISRIISNLGELIEIETGIGKNIEWPGRTCS